MNRLYVVGIGPGNPEGMTEKARNAIKEADIIVGYTVYCDLLRPYYPEKTFLSTPMMKETERCRIALSEAEKGKTAALVCSGDAGIYGMASLVLSLLPDFKADVEIIPGVTAASSGAALLGSPLSCDFAVISLSDLLTPKEDIEKRIEFAAAGDFCIVFYNPGSKKRTDCLRKACETVLKYRSPDTVCGITKNIGRDGESAELLTLSKLSEYSPDMFTTVFIGNSKTKEINGKMVTLRGYGHE